VPILYNGDPDWYGNLVSQDDGSFLETCIPRHLEFIRKRKQAHETDFAHLGAGRVRVRERAHVPQG
jgi:hypothetical protein